MRDAPHVHRPKALALCVQQAAGPRLFALVFQAALLGLLLLTNGARL